MLVFANLGDAANINVTLSVREVAPDVPVVALADEMSSVDIRELAGISDVIALHVNGESVTNPPADTELAGGAEPVMLGTRAQPKQFGEEYG